MKVIVSLFIVVFALAFVSEGKTQAIETVSVKIKTEKRSPKSGLKIRFLNLTEDSRCPTDTNCIWAGNAKIILRVSKNGQAKEIEMHTNGPNHSVDFNGYRLTLIKLTPVPRSNIRINRNGYVATLKVERTGK